MNATKTICKPGDRVRIIGGSSLNIGKIGVVVRAYRLGEMLSGHEDWIVGRQPWVILSLGAPFRCRKIIDRVVAFEWPVVMQIPVEDECLLPLRDDDNRQYRKATNRATKARAKLAALGGIQ